MLLKAGTDGATKALLETAAPGMPAMALPLTGDVAVQVHNSDSRLCWSSVFGAEDVLVNDGDKGVFKAKNQVKSAIAARRTAT